MSRRFATGTGAAGQPTVLPVAPRASKRPLIVCGVGLTIVAVAIASLLLRGDERVAAIDLDAREPLALPTQETVKEEHSPFLDPLLRYPIPSVRGVALPERFPSLTDWTHPVVAIGRKVPLIPDGHFGAERAGVLRVKCGRGHCGTDLEGPRGRPIVAVTSGVVLHIDRSRNGKDGRSGRYVRIKHDDGAVTAYMHLDSIERTLRVGDHVAGGQQIGTLGATGVQTAQPHVHFSLEIPGRYRLLKYIDPAPFLVRATVLDKVDRQRTPKPLW